MKPVSTNDMVTRDELIAFINKIIGSELLAKAAQKDEMANGVQILGGENVKVVTFGVSLNEEILQKAVKKGSNFCIFHHGFDVRTVNSRYSLSAQKRLRLIFQNDITIMSLHYVLDTHPVIGNNAQIIKLMGARLGESLFDEWGFVGHFDKSTKLDALRARCREIFKREILAFDYGSENVRTIGVVSGAGKPYQAEFEEIREKGVELFISGETSESVPHKMKENGMNYFVCGHYATEVFGVKALGKKIEEQFAGRLAIEFIDVPNPI